MTQNVTAGRSSAPQLVLFGDEISEFAPRPLLYCGQGKRRLDYQDHRANIHGTGLYSRGRLR